MSVCYKHRLLALTSFLSCLFPASYHQNRAHGGFLTYWEDSLYRSVIKHQNKPGGPLRRSDRRSRHGKQIWGNCGITERVTGAYSHVHQWNLTEKEIWPCVCSCNWSASTSLAPQRQNVQDSRRNPAIVRWLLPAASLCLCVCSCVCEIQTHQDSPIRHNEGFFVFYCKPRAAGGRCRQSRGQIWSPPLQLRLNPHSRQPVSTFDNNTPALKKQTDSARKGLNAGGNILFLQSRLCV